VLRQHAAKTLVAARAISLVLPAAIPGAAVSRALFLIAAARVSVTAAPN
jgi:hypothetical protein